jgi:hypothetical protein
MVVYISKRGIKGHNCATSPENYIRKGKKPHLFYVDGMTPISSHVSCDLYLTKNKVLFSMTA